MRGLASAAESGGDDDWQSSLAAWANTRRGSLQATGAVHRAELVTSVQATEAEAEALRVSAEVRLRNRPLSERIRDRFRSLHDSDLLEEDLRRSLASAHAVEELLALRAAPSAASGGCADLGLRLGGSGGGDGAPVRVTSIELGSPADASGLRPGDRILSVDGESAGAEPQASAVDRRIADSVLADGVAHIRVRRLLPKPRDPALPPLPPLDTLPGAVPPDELLPTTDSCEPQHQHQHQHQPQQRHHPRMSMPDIYSDGQFVRPKRFQWSAMPQQKSRELTSDETHDSSNRLSGYSEDEQMPQPPPPLTTDVTNDAVANSATRPAMVKDLRQRVTSAKRESR